MTGTVAPLRQYVIALMNWTFLIIESPIMNVVGVGAKSEGMGSGSVITGDGTD